MSLLKQTTENKSKKAKRGISLLLALTAALSAGACRKKPVSPDELDPNPGTTQTDPTNPSNPSNPSNPNTPNYSKYSSIMQTVLTSDFYKNIRNDNHCTLNDTGAIPYSVWERLGYSEKDIRDTTYDVDCVCVLKEKEPNSIYVSNRMAFREPFNYYHFLTVKINFTNQEMEEFKSLANHTAYQTGFFIQEASKRKNVEIIGNAKMGQECYKELLRVIKNYSPCSTDVFGYDDLDISLLDFSVENNYIKLNVRASNNYANFSKMVSRNDNIKTSTLTLHAISGLTIRTATRDSSIYVWPYNEVEYYDNDYTSYQQGMQKASYVTTDHSMKNDYVFILSTLA